MSSDEIIQQCKKQWFVGTKSKSKLTATPTKTTGQTTAQRQPLPSDKNLGIFQPAISLELRQTNHEEKKNETK